MKELHCTLESILGNGKVALEWTGRGRDSYNEGQGTRRGWTGKSRTRGYRGWRVELLKCMISSRVAAADPHASLGHGRRISLSSVNVVLLNLPRVLAHRCAGQAGSGVFTYLQKIRNKK